jgi:DNA-binding transcriptional ArsR family regulator
MLDLNGSSELGGDPAAPRVHQQPHSYRQEDGAPVSAGHEAAEEVLAAFADPMRRRILEVLAACGPATATTVAARLPVTRQAVVKHLAVLGQAGLVEGHRSGREVRYLVRPQPLEVTATWLAGLASEWDRRLQAIKRIAESGT